MARRRGASVTLVSGPTSLRVPAGVKCNQVSSAEEMRAAVLEVAAGADVIIKAAAVADYRPVSRSGQKLKKTGDEMVLELEKNPDILAELGADKGELILVGFAAETERLLAHAAEKLKKKNLDLIVANDITREGAGFNVDTNIVRFLYADGKVEELGLMSKEQVAERLLDQVAELWKAKRR